ncbi:13140_t:CDS:2, partial [Gigaspora margarita]
SEVPEEPEVPKELEELETPEEPKEPEESEKPEELFQERPQRRSRKESQRKVPDYSYLTNITVHFLPPNMIAHLQPMDAGNKGKNFGLALLGMIQNS